MDFYQTQDHYILGKDEYTLWCNRVNGNLKLRPVSSIKDLQVKPKCSGVVYGVVGKIQFLPGSDPKLVLITKRYAVGNLTDEHIVYRIDKIAVVPLSAEECPEINLDVCEEHKNDLPSKPATREVQPRVTQTFNNFKTSLANQFKGTSKTNIQKTTEKDGREKEKLDKLERRLQEEFVKMFNDSESFYYSEHGDLTNTVQRNDNKCDESKKLPIWRTADERFFWNKAMLKEIITLTESEPNANDWIMPIIQGYVQTAKCEVDFSDMDDLMLMQISPEKFDLILISRRSVTRAGTRYKRRGVDEEGHVANYVETEQIVCAGHHHLSFVQVRGSIPLYWSQLGIKYRPPPKLERNKEESQQAMKKHFEQELAFYKSVKVINLVDQTGREQILSEALMEHIIAYGNESLTYVTFDFHEYCRGMKFENVAVLVEKMADIIEDIRYCWVDRHGIICKQRGVFRVNCMDCLDRTNVVQASLARFVLESQLRKLGRLMPEESLPSDVRDTYQDMWANNGDAISRQYAGTAAMKGDFTRTGERRFTGVMKDGYHSANRYLNRFTAAYRQTVIDIMLGIPPTEDISLLIAAMKQPDDPGEEWTMQREEWVAQLVEHCQHLLVSGEDVYLGGWALIEPLLNYDDEGPDLEQEVVLLLTEQAFYVASYDEDEECVNQYERQPLENLEKLEIGPDSAQKTRNSYLRVHYRSCRGDGGYFHTFKALQNRTSGEGEAVLRGIADEFHRACEGMQLNPKISECRLNKKKSKPHNVIQISSKTRPFSADERRRYKNTVTSDVMVHSASAPAELDKFASADPSHVHDRQNSCTDVPRLDTPEGDPTVSFDNNVCGGGDDDDDDEEEETASLEPQCGLNNDANNVVSQTYDCPETNESSLQSDLSTRDIENQKDETNSNSADNLPNEILGSESFDTRTNGNEEKIRETDLTSGSANFKRSSKNRLGDVSIKFQKNKDSVNTTEILWQNEGDPSSSRESPKSTRRRNIFVAAQERGRTFIPDLKNKLSGLSNRSPKLERRKVWEQIIKDHDCKTTIIQI